jgi:hypothetical protein
MNHAYAYRNLLLSRREKSLLAIAATLLLLLLIAVFSIVRLHNEATASHVSVASAEARMLAAVESQKKAALRIEELTGGFNTLKLEANQLRSENKLLNDEVRKLGVSLASARAGAVDLANSNKRIAAEKAKLAAEKAGADAKLKAAVIPQSSVWLWIKSYMPGSKNAS